MTNSRRFDQPMRYRIKIHGRLEPGWAMWFDDFMLMPQENNVTVLVGTVADQAALHGLLARIRDLGLPLLSLSGQACQKSADEAVLGEKME